MKSIGIQGGRASYHEQVAQQLHPDYKIEYYETFKEEFEGLRVGAVGSIICAISNSHIGPISESNTELEALHGNYRVLHEVPWPVHHALLAVEGAKLSDLRQVYSQLPALDQCQSFLNDVLPNAEQIETEDTALSAELVSKSASKRLAAIASLAAGELYGLTPLLTNIQDDPENITNFIEITLA